MANGTQARDESSKVIPNMMQPGGTTQKLNSSGSSTPSSAFTNTTNVRIVADAACHYKIAVAPVAAATDVYLPANAAEPITIKAGNKIAVIGTVNLYVTEYN
jgi:hypothetical protein